MENLGREEEIAVRRHSKGQEKPTARKEDRGEEGRAQFSLVWSL